MFKIVVYFFWLGLAIHMFGFPKWKSCSLCVVWNSRMLDSLNGNFIETVFKDKEVCGRYCSVTDDSCPHENHSIAFSIIVYCFGDNISHFWRQSNKLDGRNLSVLQSQKSILEMRWTSFLRWVGLISGAASSIFDWLLSNSCMEKMVIPFAISFSICSSAPTFAMWICDENTDLGVILSVKRRCYVV